MARPDEKQLAAVSAVCAAQNLRKAARAVTQRFDEAMAPSGLRVTQLVVLVTLASAQDTTPARLAHELGLDLSTLNRALKTLAEKNLVARERMPGGRRLKLSLTDQGWTAIEAALPLWARTQETLMAELGGAAWEALRAQLHAIAASRN